MAVGKRNGKGSAMDAPVAAKAGFTWGNGRAKGRDEPALPLPGRVERGGG